MAGISNDGFVPLSLSEIQTDLQQAVQAAFGGTAVDLSSQSLFGQLIGIIANANADLWQGLAGLYAGSYPAGATGVALDNILALAGLSRLPAKATVTNPTTTTGASGQTLYGLVLRGTAGTVIPSGTLLSNSAASPATFALDNAVTIQPANNETQVVYFSNVATSGSYKLTLTSPNGEALTTPAIAYNANLLASTLTWSNFSQTSNQTFQLVIDGSKTTPNINYGGTAKFGPNSFIVGPLTAQAIQQALNKVTGYESVTVTGDPSTVINVYWNQAVPGILTATGQGGPDGGQPSINAMISALADASGTRPFTDVTLTSEAQNIVIQYGQNKPLAGMPSTGMTFVPLAQVSANTLARGSSATFANVVQRQAGSAAQGVGSATCTSTGAISCSANQLTTIVNPVSGLSSVNNDLDCVIGQDVESDAEAVARLQSVQGVGSKGSLAAILSAVRAVSGVTQAVGFQNTTSASQQVIQFASTPTQGSFSLFLAGQTTAQLPYSAQAADVQAAVQALNGLSAVQVRAYRTNGFTIIFDGDAGKQSQPLCTFPSNTTGVALTAYYGRGAHAVEILAQGGQDSDIAEAILETLPAGISCYGDPVLRTTASLTANQQLIAPTTTDGVTIGNQVFGPGIPLGSTVSAVNSGVVTLSQAPLASVANAQVSFAAGGVLSDSEGNKVDILFSRPASVLVWAEINLLTDLYNTPGVPSSGLNPQSRFSQASVAAIQADVISIINSTPIGGLIVASGSNSLVGSFRDQPGILSFRLSFDRSNPPQNQANLQLNDNESAVAETFSVSVNIT